MRDHISLVRMDNKCWRRCEEKEALLHHYIYMMGM